MSSINKLSMKQLYDFSNLITCNDGQISTRVIVENRYTEVVLYGIGKDAEFEGNSNACELLVQFVEGEGILKCDGMVQVKAGQILCIPPNNGFAISSEIGMKLVVTKLVEPTKKNNEVYQHGDDKTKMDTSKKQKKSVNEFDWRVFKF